jgi:hypothetical protein
VKIKWFCNKYYISNGLSKRCNYEFTTKEVKETHCPLCNSLLNSDKDKAELITYNTHDKEYIGYEDNKGTKIHEGDLVNWFGTVALVEWSEKYNQFEADVKVDVLCELDWGMTEIVGNIETGIIKEII